MTNEIKKDFDKYWWRFYGHEFQPSNPVDKEIRNVFKNAYMAGFEAGHKAGAETKIKAERDKVLEEVDKICGYVIEAWDKAGEPIGTLAVQDVLDLIQKLKELQ